MPFKNSAQLGEAEVAFYLKHITNSKAWTSDYHILCSTAYYILRYYKLCGSCEGEGVCMRIVVPIYFAGVHCHVCICVGLCTRMLLCAFACGTHRPPVELDEDQVPDLQHVGVVHVDQVGGVAASDAVEVDLAAGPAGARVAHLPEIILHAAGQDAALLHPEGQDAHTAPKGSLTKNLPNKYLSAAMTKEQVALQVAQRYEPCKMRRAVCITHEIHTNKYAFQILNIPAHR